MTQIVYLYPSGPFEASKPVNGIQQVVNAQRRYLPARDWRIGDDPAKADVVASHAGAADGAAIDVAHCHGLYPTAMRQMSRTYYEINARVIEDLRKAKAVTVPSEWVAQMLRRDMHLRPAVIPHGIHLDEWTNIVAKRPKARLRVLWNKNRSADVCDVGPVTGLARARPALEMVSTFAGEDAPANVTVVGLLPYHRMKELLGTCHIYLATTRETFGIGTVEAMAAGLPVVGYRWAATPEVVGDAGILVSPGDVGALAEAVDEVAGKWREYSVRAFERSREFGWERVIGMYDEVYRWAAAAFDGPRVTVVIPCYNYAEKVGRAILSVKAQTLRHFECIVVNDGSSDASEAAILEAIRGDARFRYVRQSNAGVAEARNRGFAMANGEYLCPLDADDALEPEFLQRTVEFLDAHPDVALAYTGLAILNSKRVCPWPTECNFDLHAERHNQVPTCCLFRHSVIERTGGYRQRFHPAEDAELWLRVGELGMVIRQATKEPLFLYDFHAGSASAEVRSGKKNEPDWLHDHPWVKERQNVPLACLAKPVDLSHPVRDYDQPVVAVVIPVGDGHEREVLGAVDSLEAQTEWRWECVVVDDTTEQKLELPGQPFVWIVRTGGRKGPAAARNAGVQNSSAPWLVFLDADDRLTPQFLEVVLAEAWPGTYVYTDWYDGDGKHHRAEAFDEEKLRMRAIHAVTFLHERKAWEAVGGMDEGLRGWEDWDYVMKLAAVGTCGTWVESPLFVYRYGSGTRREESLKLKERLLPQIRAKWRKVEMGCSGCGKRNANRRPTMPKTQGRVAQAPVATPPPVPVAGLVLLEYVGTNTASVLITGPSGVRYRYGRNHRIFQARQDDVEYLLLRSDFRVYQTPVPAAPPVESRAVAPVRAEEVAAPPIDQLPVQAEAVAVVAAEAPPARRRRGRPRATA